MSDYSQPDFYRFNKDSLDLIQYLLGLNLTPLRILDLGAGSGILGIELSRLLNPQQLTLVELQEEYRPHIIENLNKFLSAKIKMDVIVSSFAEWDSDTLYDLIVCNPPYYLPGRGEVSENLKRAKARSFLVDCWHILLGKIKKQLSSSGAAFIVIKEEKILREEIERNLKTFALKSHFHSRSGIYIIELSHLD